MAVGDGSREAYTAIALGWAIELRKPKNRGGRGARNRRRQYVRRRHARRCRPAVVKDPITRKQTTSEPGRPRMARSRTLRSRAAAGRRGAEAAVEQTRSRTSLVVPAKRSNKAARSGGGGRGGKEARSEGWQTMGDAPGRSTGLGICFSPHACGSALRTCPRLGRSRSTSGRSPVRESRTPGSVRGAGSNPCPYRDWRRRISTSTAATRAGPTALGRGFGRRRPLYRGFS